jgi:hypothetical protein
MKAHNTKNGWQYDWHSSTWSHSLGFKILVDPTPTKSGALRCVGPYDQNPGQLSANQVLSLLYEATLRIEESAGNLGSYVVWGTSRRRDGIDGQELPMLGEGYFFTANLALRSRLIREHEFAMDERRPNREWRPSKHDHFIHHRSGVTFKYVRRAGGRISKVLVSADESQIDKALFFPDTATTMLTLLAEEGFQILSYLSRSSSPQQATYQQTGDSSAGVVESPQTRTRRKKAASLTWTATPHGPGTSEAFESPQNSP